MNSVQARRAERPRSRLYATCRRRAGTLTSFLLRPLSSPRSRGPVRRPASSVARSQPRAAATAAHRLLEIRQSACARCRSPVRNRVPFRHFRNWIAISFPDDRYHLLFRKPSLPHCSLRFGSQSLNYPTVRKPRGRSSGGGHVGTSSRPSMASCHPMRSLHPTSGR